MRPSSASAIALALAAALVAHPPLAAAQESPLVAGDVQLFLSSLQAPLPGFGAVELLVAQAPAKAEDSVRNVSGGVAWYALPAARDLLLAGPVNGTASFRAAPFSVEPIGALPVGASIQSTVTFELRRALPDGREVRIAGAQRQFNLAVGATAVDVAFAMDPGNGTLLAGEALALNVTATTTPDLATLQVLYDSTAHPGGMLLSLEAVTRGDLQLTTADPEKEAAPGGKATYAVNVRNLAQEADTVRVNVSGSPADWSVRASPGQLSVAPGSTGTVLVTVSVPGDAEEGDRHVATVTATSGLGGAAPSLNLTTTVRAPTCPGDRDCDTWSDVDESRYSTDPLDPASTPDRSDSDGDGFTNKAEVDAGTDPLDPNDWPSGAPPPRAMPGAGGGIFGGASDQVAQALGVDTAVADAIIAVALIVLALLVLLLLWLLFGGYPVKVRFAAPRGVAEPGRSVDYAVEVRSRRRRPQVVELEVPDLPEGWEARFNRPRVHLDPRAREVVGLLVRAPPAWPAPTERRLEVRARSRLKPRRFARAAAKLLLQPRVGVAEAPPLEEGLPEAERPARTIAAAPFRVSVRNLRHEPPQPERGAEVSTTATLANEGGEPERVRVLLVVNGKVRDEVTTELAPGESAEAHFRWVAHAARNEVKVVAQRA